MGEKLVPTTIVELSLYSTNIDQIPSMVITLIVGNSVKGIVTLYQLNYNHWWMYKMVYNNTTWRRSNVVPREIYVTDYPFCQ